MIEVALERSSPIEVPPDKEPARRMAGYSARRPLWVG